MRVPEAQCLFVSEKLIVFFYVDDIVILNHKDDATAAEHFRLELQKVYDFKSLGECKWFLGIRIL